MAIGHPVGEAFILLAETDLHERLHATFGFSAFRGVQEDVVARVLAHKSTLAVMPTGAGKSLTYQLPAVMMPGTCIVISPLIALMHDQLRSATANGIAAATLTSADLDREATIDRFRAGELDLHYVEPARASQTHFRELLSKTQVNLFALDTELDTAILRQAPLGNVEAGHDLDARNHRSRKPARGRLHLVHDPVHAVAHDQTVFKRLNVNVRCTCLQCMADDEADQADDGRFRCQLFELLQIFAATVVVTRLRFSDDLIHGRFARAIQALKGGIHFRRNCEARNDLALCHQLIGVEDTVIQRVNHRQYQLDVILVQRKRSRILDEPDGDSLFENGEFRIFRGCDNW